MKKYFSALLLSFVATTTFSQTTNDEVITILNTFNKNEDSVDDLNSMSFYPIGSNIYSIDCTKGIISKYNKEWNLLETHDAKQEIFNPLIFRSAKRDVYENSETGQIEIGEWIDEEPYKDSWGILRYTYSLTNLNDFSQGNDKKAYFIRATNNYFLANRAFFSLYGIIQQTWHSYIALITDIDFIDWDGNVIQKIILPYYADHINSQFINVEDKSYIIIGAYSIYNKNIPVDIDLHSEEEYNILNNAVEPESYHYFVYEYDKNSSSVQFIQTFSSLKEDKKEIGIYDINGIKLQQPQKGVNLIIYSDGPSKKVIVK